MRDTLKLAILFVAFAICLTPVWAQDEDYIVRMTTPVEVHFKNGVPNYGSGFYFETLAPPANPTSTEPQWRSVTGLYLVTAKHVIEPARISDLNYVQFYLRQSKPSGVDWYPIKLSPADLRRRLHLSPNADSDVAVVDVLDLVEGEARKSRALSTVGSQPENIPFIPYAAASEDDFPTQSKIKVRAGDDLLVIGYPRGFFDEYNKLPILKSGILITPVGMHYDGMDAFALDCKEYEGMSGSIVISKLTDLVVENDHLLINKDKQFVFLGIYTGERYQKNRATGQEKTADIGVGWYYDNVSGAINSPPALASK